MTGFEPWPTSIGIDHSVNLATITAQITPLYLSSIPLDHKQCDQIGRFIGLWASF